MFKFTIMYDFILNKNNTKLKNEVLLCFSFEFTYCQSANPVLVVTRLRWG